MQSLLRGTPNLTVRGDAAEALLLGAGDAAVLGVETASGRRVAAGAVVITTGTFLRGEIHIGSERMPAGRVGEAPAVGRRGGW